jgi:hypothetical protein
MAGEHIPSSIENILLIRMLKILERKGREEAKVQRKSQSYLNHLLLCVFCFIIQGEVKLHSSFQRNFNVLQVMSYMPS